ncbi:hypothetical protein K458DRAFT_327800 [Lentithecium fluviatile CBS 122367]|uniref:AAA+ ATPase domain-containing protein n=1 Tax=Lentithecium fluviatile CBS 122367 TaxID=1168545 RepID=A0A6G1JHZ0_9PLEO|nr:hypothetical protein K458DRAFT_327800 [Lentithecium fluviatile CBS 122367]
MIAQMSLSSLSNTSEATSDRGANYRLASTDDASDTSSLVDSQNAVCDSRPSSPFYQDDDYPSNLKRIRVPKGIRKRIRRERQQRRQERDRDILEDLDYDTFLDLDIHDATPSGDTLDALDETLAETGELCALHTFESRIDSRGERIILQVGARDSISIQMRRSQDVALVLVREYDSVKALESTTLEIRSPYIKTAMREVIKSYPGVYLDTTGSITLENEPRCLFHYRKELEVYSSRLGDPKTKQHIDLCTKYVAKTLRKEIDIYNTTMCHQEKAPGLEYSILWMAFRPGDLLYHRSHNGKELVTRLISMTREKRYRDNTIVAQDCWLLKGEQIVCIGDSFNYAYLVSEIQRYDGYTPLTTLGAFPLAYHENRNEVIQRVLERGNIYMSLLGPCYRQYDGVARMYPPKAKYILDWQTRSISQRVMFDSAEFCRNVAPALINLIPSCKSFNAKAGEHLSFTEDQILICSNEVPGFCISSKEWGIFDVANIRDIEFNSTAFDRLVLDDAKKAMITSLVREQVDGTSGFDDIVKGKGKGLIFLLYGEPGTGKTLTAESVADYTQRPLYVIGCGDLGTQGPVAENVLNTSLTLATKWNALVLMDEADVFMEARSKTELQRNELVSVLLRTLEYFEGIMFLTTNRIGSIDPAFKSRIHLSLSYPILDAPARRSIWQNFLHEGSAAVLTTRLGSDFLDRVAEENVNGRQIKNIVRVAYAQAANANRSMEPEDIIMGLVALRDFDVEFGEAQERRERTRREEHPIPTSGPSSEGLLTHFQFTTGLAFAIMLLLLYGPQRIAGNARLLILGK